MSKNDTPPPAADAPIEAPATETAAIKPGEKILAEPGEKLTGAGPAEAVETPIDATPTEPVDPVNAEKTPPEAPAEAVETPIDETPAEAPATETAAIKPGEKILAEPGEKLTGAGPAEAVETPIDATPPEARGTFLDAIDHYETERHLTNGERVIESGVLLPLPLAKDIKPGFVPPKIRVRLSGERAPLALALGKLKAGLMNRGATLANGYVVNSIESAHNWLLEQVVASCE